MEAVQAMTGRGGWPMSVFLTPERQAVFRRHVLAARERAVGMPGFDDVLAAVADAWQHRRRGRRPTRARRRNPPHDPWQRPAGELTDQPLRGRAKPPSARRSIRSAADSVRRRNSPSRSA